MMRNKNAVITFACLSVLLSCSGGGSRTPDAPNPKPPRTRAERPASNTGSGFFVSGTKLYDANGAEFRIQGVNVNHWWNTGSDNRESVPYIKAAGANAARLVFGPVEDPANPDWYVCSTTAQRRAVVEEYIKYKVVPIVEYHNATGLNSPSLIDQAVDFWIGESWVKDYERYVIVNISNEWGRSVADENGVPGGLENWRDTYLAAIAKLRRAGIKNTIVIDAINWASEISVLTQYGQTLIEADPEHNIVFSIHMYAGWRAPGDPNDDGNFYMNVDSGLDAVIAKGLPVIVGEFSKVCAAEGTWGDPEAAEDAELIDAFDERGTGWIFWMWYNENGNYQNMVYRSASLEYRALASSIVAGFSNAEEATCFPAAPVPTLPTPPPPREPDPNWNPGPLTVTIYDVSETPPNPWWLQIEMSNASSTTGEIDHVELESDGIEERVRLTLMNGADPLNFRANQNLTAYIGANSRFWLYRTDGSVAATQKNSLVQGNVFEIDTSE